MASTSAVSMVMRPTLVGSKRSAGGDASFFKPLSVRAAHKEKKVGGKKFEVAASLREKVVAGATAAVLTASMIIPDAAEAATTLTPSLQNFLLSIGAGGVVLGVIAGAVIGVANFDPVKR
ncbi:hypothetical protein M569_17426, partial [Genlisea aurea]